MACVTAQLSFSVSPCTCLLGQVEQCGEACASAQAIESATDGFGLWALTATFCGLVLIATTFISHTVGAIVILPIVGAVGAEMQVGPSWQALVWLPGTLQEVVVITRVVLPLITSSPN